MPMELAVKIKSEIEGIKVDRKTRVCVHGRLRRKNRTQREKTIGDFLCECAAEKTKKTIVTPKAKKWGAIMLKKNLEQRKRADSMLKSRQKKG